jgi:hypothetical protein
MDNLAAPYTFLIHLRQSLEGGESLHTFLKKYLHSSKQDEFALSLEKWWVSQRNEHRPVDKLDVKLNVYRRALFELLSMSMKGASIIEPLKALELEFETLCLHDLDRHLDKLPFKLMIPMLFLQFPAVLLLLLGPLLLQFLSEVNG